MSTKTLFIVLAGAALLVAAALVAHGHGPAPMWKMIRAAGH